MSAMILHHYWPSPVAEKVRKVLGIKNASWRSVEIPRLPPKPDLMPLTGGYRLTPVLQIGADVFCDSRAIIREIDRRITEPTLFPGGADGMAWGVGEWVDGPLFLLTILAVFVDTFEGPTPEGFWKDRCDLYFGEGFDVDKTVAELPNTLAKIRAEFSWMNTRVSSGRNFMLGVEPGLPDALCHYVIWFIRGRYSGGAELLSEFPALNAWEDRMQAIGSGNHEDLASGDALDIAQAASPNVPLTFDVADPTGMSKGEAVTVAPDMTAGSPPVSGTLVGLDIDRISILREDPRVGEVCVHFPRVGYNILRAD